MTGRLGGHLDAAGAEDDRGSLAENLFHDLAVSGPDAKPVPEVPQYGDEEQLQSN